jgi:predicted ATPase
MLPRRKLDFDSVDRCTGAVLTRFSLANFRCFASVDVPLKPLTVLVGPNDTGKSVFLRALNALEKASQPYDEKRQEGGDAFWVKGWKPEGEEVSPGVPARVEVQLFRLPSTGLKPISGASVDAGLSPPLDANGGNLPTLFDYLLRRDRKRFDEIVDVLKKRIEGLEDVQVAAPSVSERRLDYVFDGPVVLPSSDVSAGIGLLTFFVALAHHPRPAEIVLIEEPENGVHPKRLAEVVALLRALAKGEFSGRPTQVILSTHSPYLLDQIHLPEDEVLVFRRAPDGTRTVEPADAERLQAFLGEFMMGEIWFNRGEDGLVKASAA